MSLLTPIPKLDDTRIVAAIGAAEARTSGEIRVLVSAATADDPVAAAKQHFERLGMTATQEKNGVLIFVSPPSHTFAVIGDRGIHEKCGETFWQELAEAMGGHFKRGDFTLGVCLAIERAGELLARHFPRQPDDRNELPDRVENV